MSYSGDGLRPNGKGEQMTTLNEMPVSGYLGKAFNRAFWRGLTPDARIELRREYRYLRKTTRLPPRWSAGVVTRILAVTAWDH